jgi:hypothetical protein
MTTFGIITIIIAAAYLGYWVGRRKERAQWVRSTLHRRVWAGDQRTYD